MDGKKNADWLLTMAILAALWTAPAVHAQPWLVRGTVRDAATGQPLPAATVQLAGTYRGTIANDEGEYLLEVQQLPATLKVSYIGYASQEQSVRGVGDASVLTAPAERVNFALTPVPFQFDPIVVTAENSAEDIMRQVMRRKQAWRPGLTGYRAQAYTRRVLENEEGIVSIGELASEIYWERERGLREVVKSRRVTRNLDSHEAYTSALEGFTNFYDDDIPFIGHTLIGPTHPDALEHYHFRLIGQRYLDDKVVFDISVEPKNKLQAAFVGRVAVLDEDFGLLEVELAPSRATAISAIPLPLIEQMDFAYQQQFRGFAGGVWLPVDYRASMAIKISMVGLHFPAIKYNVVTRLDDYQVNVDLPDSLYASEEVLRVDSLAVAQDSSFARLADKVPLSAREQAAYATIDSTMRFEQAFQPTGFLARLLVREEVEQAEVQEEAEQAEDRAESSRWGSVNLKPALQYDRVGGAHLGLEGNRGLVSGLEAGAAAGYNVGLKRWSYRGRVGWQQTAGGVVLEYGRGPVPRTPSDSYSLLLNSGQFLLGLDDYFDYYWNERLRAQLHLSLPGQVGWQVGFNHEAHSSLRETTAFSLLNRNWRPRPNPAIEAGRLRSVEASFRWGEPYQPFGLTANQRVEVGVEHSSTGLGSDFSFTRLHLALDGHFNTFLKRRVAPNALDVRLVAGHSIGDVPVQRFGSLEASMGFFSPFGAFRTVRGHPYEGDHYAALYWEHNFKTTPFELLGLWGWAMRGTGLVVHGASGRTWIDPKRRAALGYDPRYEEGFRHEVGVSLMLYHLLRLDITRRLDRPGWSAGLSLARFDFGVL